MIFRQPKLSPTSVSTPRKQFRTSAPRTPFPFRQTNSHHPSSQPRQFKPLSPTFHSPSIATAMSSFVTPGQQRYMRACMVCSIVMTYSVSVSHKALPCKHTGELNSYAFFQLLG